MRLIMLGPKQTCQDVARMSAMPLQGQEGQERLEGARKLDLTG